MEHFDDMLRNTIANDYPENRFEFREEYWLQAQVLIESYERKRKRRAIFWVFTGLLLTTAVVWYFYAGSTPEQTTPGAQPAVQETLQPPMAIQQDATTTPVANEPVQHASTADKNAAFSGNPTAATNTSLNSSNPSNYTTSNKNTVQKRIADNNSENNTHTANTYGSSQKTVLPTPQPGLQPDAGISSPEQPGAVNITVAPGRVQSLQTIESPAFQSVKSLTPVQQPVLAMSPTASPAALAETSTVTQKAQAHKWHTGLTVFAGSSENIFKKEYFSTGLGWANQFKINRKWSVNADLLWRRRNPPSAFTVDGLPVSANTDAIISEDQVITYSFGYQLARTTTTLEAMHFAELPVYVSRHFGKWGVDAGGMLTLPLLSKTHSVRNESGTLNKIETTTGAATQYKWNTDQIGKSIIPGLVAGINFEPFRNLSIGVRGIYNLSKNDYSASFIIENVEPSILNRSLSPFSADLRVKWLF